MILDTLDYAGRRAGSRLLGALRGGVGATALLGLTVVAPPAAWAAQAPAAAPAAKAKKPAQTQNTDDDEDDTELSGLVVSSNPRPQPGAVIGDIKPELQLGPTDIQSYGVSTVTDLLNELAPQTQSDRGRGGEQPVILLNGRPISGMNEIANIPTEAILRVDILPEEVALKYGYTANQRVVNIVLRRFFRSVSGEIQGGTPTEGGQETGQGEIDQFTVRRDNRLNLDLKYSASSSLTEDSRDVIPLSSGQQPYDLLGNITSTAAGGQIPALSALAGQPVTVAGVPAAALTRNLALADFGPTAGVANTSDTGQYRTLLPATQAVTANGVLSRVIFNGISATVNATLGATTSKSLQGLPGIDLTVPANDPFSPLGSDVALDRYVDAFGPLRQNIDGWTAHLGTAFNRDVGKWRMSLTSTYDHTDSQTYTDTGLGTGPLQGLLNAASPTVNPFGPTQAGLLTILAQNKARSDQDSEAFRFLASGPSLKLPAGPLYTSFKISDSESTYATRSDTLNMLQVVNLSRNVFNGQVNVDVPVASKRNHFLAFLGDLSLNGNTALDHVSGFGDLQVLGYGANWTPFTGFNLIVSHTRDQAAPTVQQLGGPVVLTPGVRLLDYATGQTVDVTKITGGAAQLIADHRDVLKIGLTWKPFTSQDLTLTANYINSRIRNPIATFPAATAEIEQAFPDRFIRDATGELTEVDYRPVNFAEQDRKELRWGINFTHRIGPPPPTRPQRRAGFLAAAGVPGARRPRDGQAAQARRAQQAGPGDGDGAPQPGADGAPPPGADAGAGPGGGGPGAGPGPGGDGGGNRGGGGGFGGGRGGGGFGGGGRRGGGPPPDQGGQVQFAIYHTVFFDDQILVRQGGPLLDLLNGSAAGNGGGQPRHLIQAQAGVTLKGFGARISANWQSATTVQGGVDSSTGNLTFSSLGTLNLRLFANLGGMRSLVEHRPWLRGSRLTFSVVNLFDTREQVHDATGATPLSYQQAYLDPTGRTLHLDFRKLFF